MFSYYLPTRVYFGFGSLNHLADISLLGTAKKILLVAGEHLKKDNTVEKITRQANKDILVYEAPIVKSDLETINNLTLFSRKIKPDLIIAIGGGTILDTAKSAAILTNNPGSVNDYVKDEKKIVKVGVPLIAVPTTAGTGSEVTPWAVIWDTKNKKKYSLSSPLIFPAVALVDSQLTFRLPEKITASTGADALCQAIEAFWSKNHNPVSDVFALKAIKLIMLNLRKAVKKPNKFVRGEMALASLLSGMAFSNTKTNICHSISYPLTAHFDIPHGQAVVLTLSSFLKYNFKILDKQRARRLLSSIGAEDLDEAVLKIDRLIRNIGLEKRLSKLGIKEEDLDLIIGEGFALNRIETAPRIPSENKLKNILKKIL